jgi:hypothetical protein
METSKNANRMDTQKTWQLAFLSITHDQEVQIEFYIAIEHNIIYNIYISLELLQLESEHEIQENHGLNAG